MATHSCDVGYGLSGGSMRTCQSDRTWSGGEITCQRESYSLSGLLLTVIKRYKGVSCGNPPPVDNGLRTFRGTLYQDTATYSCNSGYLLSGSATVTCQASGSWSTRPTCFGNLGLGNLIESMKSVLLVKVVNNIITLCEIAALLFI